MGRNVLVTAISGDVGNSILKCLASDVSSEVGHLYGCDIYCFPCGINKVEKFFQVVPCCEAETYLHQLLSICEEFCIEVIVPTNEQEIALLNQRRELFQDRGVKLLLHQPNVYEVFFDKFKTQELLKELGLPYIHTWYSSEYVGQSAYPLILKDTFSCGSKNLHLVYNDTELKCKIRKDKTQIVQCCVGTESSEYTVPLFSGDGV